MKTDNKLSAFVFILILTASCGKFANDAVLEEFQAHFHGKANNGDTVTLDLRRHGENLHGFILYSEARAPLAVQGTITGNRVDLTEFPQPALDNTPLIQLNGQISLRGGVLQLTLTRNGIDGAPFTCSLKEQYAKAERFTPSSFVQTQNLAETDPNSPTAAFSSIDLLPAGKDGFRSAFLADYFGSLEPGRHYADASETYFAGWKEQIGGLYNSDPSAHSLSWEYFRRCNVVFNGSRLVIILMDEYEFTGGAHGKPSIDYFVWDKKLGKRLSYEDVFKPAYEVAVAALIMDCAREAAGLKPGEPLTDAGYFGEAFPFGDTVAWYLTPAGLTVKYGAYAVAPYSSGLPEVFVPMEKIRPFLSWK